MMKSSMTNIEKKEYFVLIIGYVIAMLLMTAYYLYQPSRYGTLQRYGLVTIIAMAVMLLMRFLQIERKKNEDSLLDELIRWRYHLCFVSLVFFSILGIHGYSINLLEAYYPNDSKWSTLVFGLANPIQGDVWAIGIPQIVNQINTGFPLLNKTMMTQGGNTVLSGLPALEWSIIGQPHYWGCFLGARFGIAWLYWFKKFALLLGSYEVICFLNKNRKHMALLGALVITTSPLMNWWFGHTVTTVPIYAQCCVACVIGYMNNIYNTKKKIICGICGGICAIGYVMGWYPALQVSFGYLMLILMCAVLVRSYREKGFLFKRIDFVILACVFLAVALVVGRFLYVSWDSIQQLNSTLVPGKRVSRGGNYGWSIIATYLFAPLFALKAPGQGNACEDSTILPFMPFVYVAVIILVVYWFRRRTLKENILFVILFLYLLFLTSWLFIQYPESFAKITLFSYVTETRSLWCSSFIITYLGFMCLVPLCEEQVILKGYAFIISVLSMGTFYFLIRNYIDREYLNFLVPSIFWIVLVFGVMTVFGHAFLAGKKKMVTTMLLVMCVGFEISINPLEIGTGVLEDSSFSKTISEVAEMDPDALWASEGAFVFGNMIYSQGVRTFNTTNQYMDSEKWKALDPSGSQEEIYNRYAQCQIQLTDQQTEMIYPPADMIQINLNYKETKNLGIDYFVTYGDLNSRFSDASKYYELVITDSAGMSVYRVK